MSINELQPQLKTRKKKYNSLHVTSLPGSNTAHSIRRVYPAWSPMNKEAIIHTKSVNMTHKTTTGRGNGRQEKIWDINQVTPEKITMKMCRYEIHDIGTTVQRQRQCKNIVKRSLYPPVEYSPFRSHTIRFLNVKFRQANDSAANKCSNQARSFREGGRKGERENLTRPLWPGERGVLEGIKVCLSPNERVWINEDMVLWRQTPNDSQRPARSSSTRPDSAHSDLLLQKLRSNHIRSNHGVHGRHGHGRHSRHGGHIDHAGWQ